MILFEHVSKSFDGGATFAVRDLSLEIVEGETLVLLGTSGSGKTTSMKMINRLIDPTSGRILINGTDITDQNPIRLRRNIGYAIQDIGLFPHMTAGENIAVVPRLLKWPLDRIGHRIDELLNLVGLSPQEFRNRFPHQLSGGERQRIGVVRALAADPPIILMDEPFGALDPITREQLQNDFIDLESTIKKTVVFVTHDIFEAVKMGDRVAILNEGLLQQIAAPAELVENPANEFVDQFLGRHRFQLSLLTKTLRSILTATDSHPEPEVSSIVRLQYRNSLLDALDAFKKHNSSILPVYDGGVFHGNLSRHRLLTAITDVLGSSESSQ